MTDREVHREILSVLRLNGGCMDHDAIKAALSKKVGRNRLEGCVGQLRALELVTVTKKGVRLNGK